MAFRAVIQGEEERVLSDPEGVDEFTHLVALGHLGQDAEFPIEGELEELNFEEITHGMDVLLGHPDVEKMPSEENRYSYEGNFERVGSDKRMFRIMMSHPDFRAISLDVPFSKACEHGHVDIIREIMNDSRFSVSSFETKKAFIWACQLDAREVVKEIMSHEKFSEFDLVTLSAAFHHIVRLGHVELCEIFMEHPLFVTIPENTLLDFISEERIFEEVSSEALGKMLRNAVAAGKLNVAYTMMLNERFSEISRKDFGLAFYAACRNGDKDLVETLLLTPKGSKLNSNHLNIALNIARERGHQEVQNLLKIEFMWRTVDRVKKFFGRNSDSFLILGGVLSGYVLHSYLN